MRVSVCLLAFCFLAACESTPDAEVAPEAAVDSVAVTDDTDFAVATLLPLAESGVSGTVEFRRLGDATEIRYTVHGLAPGDHGFHLHRMPNCGADSTGEPGSAAGVHFNPLSSPHGAPSNALTGRHAGDTGNITADASGRAQGIAIDSVLTFEGPTQLIGRAVIVHAGRDDLETQPSGDAGARLACGVTEARPDGQGAQTRTPALPE